MRAKGIDISKYQGAFTFQNNIDFIIIKATEGWGYDERFSQNLNEVKKVPRRGAYHYYRTATDPIVQAENFLSYTAGEGFHFLCVDYEGTNNTLDRAGADNLLLCLAYLRDNQELPVVLYTSQYIYRDNLRVWSAEFDTFPLWIARYGFGDPEFSNPTGQEGQIVERDWDLWQFTSKADGAEYGVQSEFVDMNVYNGTCAEMDEWLGIGEEDCCAELFAMISDTDKTLAGYAKYNNDRVDELYKRVQELEKRPWWMRWF